MTGVQTCALPILTGTFDLVFNDAVQNNIKNILETLFLAVVPGTWFDQCRDELVSGVCTDYR